LEQAAEPMRVTILTRAGRVLEDDRRKTARRINARFGKIKRFDTLQIVPPEMMRNHSAVLVRAGDAPVGPVRMGSGLEANRPCEYLSVILTTGESCDKMSAPVFLKR
jgi:hypothetical protein